MARLGNCLVIKPPTRSNIDGPAVFLSGSTAVGAAGDWQNDLTGRLSHLHITVINPWREDWDNTWKQDISDSRFKEQVNWELDYLEQADLVALYLGPNSLAPVSMLEFGLHARSGKVLACCPEGYERRGNVQVVCERFNLPLVETLDELVDRIAIEMERISRSREKEQNDGQ